MNSQQAEHVAVIMDGNGRWARERGKARISGHRRGVEVARAIVRASPGLGVSTLTLFAFSTENRRRPRAEVSALIELFAEALRKEIDELVENGVRLKFLGDRSFFSKSFLNGVREAEARTANLGGLRLNVAVNYSGRRDIANAVLGALAAGAFDAGADGDTVERALSRGLDTGDADLLIRTGGECRLSNFLLWQSAYAELYFTDALWPDFGEEQYAAALAWYANRERRFGRTSGQLRRAASVNVAGNAE